MRPGHNKRQSLWIAGGFTAPPEGLGREIGPPDRFADPATVLGGQIGPFQNGF
jgi:hypothetical protein